MKQFFESLYRNCDHGNIEIRTLPAEPGNQKFFDYKDMDTVSKHSMAESRKKNVYFGVALRNGGVRKEHVTEIPAVWCDVDYKDVAHDTVIERVKGMQFKPSIAVKSGGGLHLYWISKEPAGKDDIKRVEDVNHRLAELLTGDHNAVDAARILRVPGTVNHKYDPPAAVAVIKNKPLEYSLEDFIDNLPEYQEKKKQQAACQAPSGDDWITKAMMGCTQGQRDATAAKIAGYWINKVSARDTSVILRSWNSRNNPPLEDQEIEKVLRSVSRYEPEKEKQRVCIENVYTADRMVTSYMEYLKNLKNNRFKTGIDNIDKHIRGVGGGEVLTIIARAGSFKTAILQNMLKNYTAHSSLGAVFFSLEMPVANVTERFFSILDGCSGREVEKMFRDPGMEAPAKASVEQFTQDMKRVFVVDTRIGLCDIPAYVSLIQNELKTRVGVIGIDYLGLMDADGKDEYQAVSNVARGVKQTAKALNIPVIVLSQSSRKGGEGETEVTLEMGRGSGAIEEAADFVLGLWKVEQKAHVGRYDLICRILKNRKGFSGSRWVLDLIPEAMQIGNMSSEYIPPKATRKTI